MITEEKFEEEGKRILETLEIEWNGIVKEINLTQLIKKLYTISNLEEELKEINFSEKVRKFYLN